MSMYISFQFLQQGRSQTSEKDEASLERRRREPLGGGREGVKRPKSRRGNLMLATALP